MSPIPAARSFERFAESMTVAIHEETHMWDLDSSRTQWDVRTAVWINAGQQALTVPLHGGFPRKEILPLIKDNLSRDMDDIYLRDGEQGSYRLQGVPAEQNTGLTGLPAVTVLQESTAPPERSAHRKLRHPGEMKTKGRQIYLPRSVER